MFHNSCDIAVFDSGVGGLSVYHSIRQKLPQMSLLFYADNLFFPYGTKSDELVTRRVLEVAQEIASKYNPQILVIACNTASTLTLEKLRVLLKIPVVGVVPAIKPAANMSSSKKIALLATPATIGREYTKNLIRDFGQNCLFTEIGSSALVDIAEKKMKGLPVDHDQIKAEIRLIIEPTEIDTVVLGCTHFPLLIDEFTALVKRPLNWLDSGDAIAARIKSLLPNTEVKKKPEFVIGLSKPDSMLTKAIQNFIDLRL